MAKHARCGGRITSLTSCGRCSTGRRTRSGGSSSRKDSTIRSSAASRHATTPVAVAIGEPDITVDMAVEFLEACDAYQLRLFGPMAIYGLRASEPCLLFHEHLRGDWLDVPCLPELAYYTKGRREKRLPIIPGLDSVAADHGGGDAVRAALSAPRRGRQHRDRAAGGGVAQGRW